MCTIESPAEEVRSANSPRNSAAYVVIAFLGIAVGFLLALLYFQKTAATPTTRELSTALGIRYWQFQIPDDVGDKFLGFEIHNGESDKNTGGSNGWTPGETVLVTVRPLIHCQKLECSVVGESGHLRELIDNPFASGFGLFHYTPNHQIVNDIPLIKSRRNVDAVTMPVNNTESGEVTLRLAFSD